MGLAKTAMGCFNHYCDFEGRATRGEYWSLFAFNAINYACLYYMCRLVFDYILPALPEHAIDASHSIDKAKIAFVAFSLIYFFATFMPSLCVAVRRLHDMNISGYWLMASLIVLFIPGVNILMACLVSLVFALPGTRGSNRYGPAHGRYA